MTMLATSSVIDRSRVKMMRSFQQQAAEDVQLRSPPRRVVSTNRRATNEVLRLAPGVSQWPAFRFSGRLIMCSAFPSFAFLPDGELGPLGPRRGFGRLPSVILDFASMKSRIFIPSRSLARYHLPLLTGYSTRNLASSRFPRRARKARTPSSHTMSSSTA